MFVGTSTDLYSLPALDLAMLRSSHQSGVPKMFVQFEKPTEERLKDLEVFKRDMDA